MTEAISSSPEDDAPRKAAEAGMLISLREFIYDLYENAAGYRKGPPSDGCFDYFDDYCVSLATRDPDMAALLVDGLGERADRRAAADQREAWTYRDLAQRIIEARTGPGGPPEGQAQS